MSKQPVPDGSGIDSAPPGATPEPGLWHWVGSAYDGCRSTWQLRQQEEQILAALADPQLDPARRQEEEYELAGLQGKPVATEAFASQIVAGEGWSDHLGPWVWLATQRTCWWLLLPAPGRGSSG